MSNFLLPQTLQGLFLYMNVLPLDTGWGWSSSLRSMLREVLLTRLPKISNSTLLPPLTLRSFASICNHILYLSVCSPSPLSVTRSNLWLFSSLPVPRACNMLGSSRLSSICEGTEWVISWANEELCRVLREKDGMLVLRMTSLAGEFGHFVSSLGAHSSQHGKWWQQGTHAVNKPYGFSIFRTYYLEGSSKAGKVIKGTDLKKGFWKVEISPENRTNMIWLLQRDFMTLRHLPFWVRKAPTTLQGLVHKFLLEMESIMIMYVENTIIFNPKYGKTSGWVGNIEVQGNDETQAL